MAAAVVAFTLPATLSVASHMLLARAGSAGLAVTTGTGGVIDVSDVSVDLVFDPAQEGGISRVYDLTTDPGRTVNVGPPSGYTVFNTYVNNGGWANIGRGTASVLEMTRSGSGSAVVHAVGAFMREDGSGPVPGLQHETWTTIYPGGHVFIRRHLITGASAVVLSNFGGKAIDVSSASSWNGIFTGAASDSSYPNSANTSAGNGSESWIGFWQAGSGPGQSLSVGMSSWQSQDFGFTYQTIRVLVGNASASLRSHEAQRTESGVTLAANTTYSAQFLGWFSAGIRIALMNAQVLDYRSPALSVSSGTLATTDSEPVSTALTNGFNPATGAYVVSSTGTGATLQLQFPNGVTTRNRPAFKLTGWPGSSVQVQLAGATLALGSDYLADFDTGSGTLRLVFLKEIVASSPQAGQLQSGQLVITPTGAPLPSPSPRPSPSPTPSPSLSPSPSPSPSPATCPSLGKDEFPRYTAIRAPAGQIRSRRPGGMRYPGQEAVLRSRAGSGITPKRSERSGLRSSA